MNKGVLAFLSFAGGFTIGAAGSWIFAVNKYQKVVDGVLKDSGAMDQGQDDESSKFKVQSSNEVRPEISDIRDEETKTIEQEPSVKATEPKSITVEEAKIEAVSNDHLSLENNFQKQAAKIAREKPDIINYNKMIKEYKYIPDPHEEDEEYSEYPYLVKDGMVPFGEKTDSEGNPYEKVTLIFYEDGVVADTTYEIIDDVDRIIGNDNLSHFGDYPNHDEIYVRNDVLKEDITVCMSLLTWEGDILQRMPYLRSVER